MINKSPSFVVVYTERKEKENKYSQRGSVLLFLNKFIKGNISFFKKKNLTLAKNNCRHITKLLPVND